MKHYVPDYYGSFACIKGACRHSCCIGWEIDIDEKALARYRSVPGSLGEKLRENIIEQDETACFRLDADERCPFLDENGLCELILKLGEDSLCRICADHPRYRSFFSDRVETGLGLCCEAAGRLILTRQEPVNYICIGGDDQADAPAPEEAQLIRLRSALLDIARDRSLPVQARLEQLMSASGLSMEIVPAEWAEFLLALERLDEAWTDHLEALRQMPANMPPLQADSLWQTGAEQLLVYLLMRHMPGALEDGMTGERIVFCVLICEILHALLQLQFARAGEITPEDFIETARLYSSEIEYSDENIAAILEEISFRCD